MRSARVTKRKPRHFEIKTGSALNGTDSPLTGVSCTVVRAKDTEPSDEELLLEVAGPNLLRIAIRDRKPPFSILIRGLRDPSGSPYTDLRYDVR